MKPICVLCCGRTWLIVRFRGMSKEKRTEDGLGMDAFFHFSILRGYVPAVQ